MRAILIFSAAMLALIATSNGQITKHYKYDWGWSYQLEMPETGLKCEFPEKPVISTRNDGWMAASSHKDELYVVLKTEIGNPANIQSKVTCFLDSLRSFARMPIGSLEWTKLGTENGYTMAKAMASGNWAQYQIEASVVNNTLTVFVHSYHDELSIPGYFFATSYSLWQLPLGSDHAIETTSSANTVAKHTDKVEGKYRVPVSSLKLVSEWPELPATEQNTHGQTYRASTGTTSYAVQIIELNSQLSYTYFNSFVNRENRALNEVHARVGGAFELVDDVSEVVENLGSDEEVFFRTIKHTINGKEKTQRFIGVDGRIIIQEVETRSIAANSTDPFIRSLENSLRDKYENTFVAR